MVNNVLISLVSRQVDGEGEITDTSLTVAGKYCEKAGNSYITYKETRLTGMEGTTTLLRIEPGRVSVIRIGSVEAKQVFVKGKRHTFPYITVCGTFEMTVNPWVVEACLREGEGRILLEYDLEIEGNPASRNSVRIEVAKIANRELRTVQEMDGGIRG